VKTREEGRRERGEGRREIDAVKEIRGFRDLKVWQKAMDAAMLVFELSKRFPKCEMYSLTDQVRRSSRSVPSNIAEAWRKRRYPAAFVSRLNDAEGEGAETQTHVEIALRCGYLSTEEARSLDHAYEEVLAMLASMASHPEKWTLRKPE
jgi:four helix bundle protein